ncbi:BURP domain protein rd22, partial [Sarracenia purpurea var. burkii]
MEKSIKECEDTGIKGEEKYCATSLESMVDFSTSKLGKKVGFGPIRFQHFDFAG